jgi:hypothetical protein
MKLLIILFATIPPLYGPIHYYKVQYLNISFSVAHFSVAFDGKILTHRGCQIDDTKNWNKIRKEFEASGYTITEE